MINPSDYIQFVDVAGDGKAVVLGARGDVFHLALADKDALPRNLTGTPGVREDTPRLSPDGKRVAYFSDATGEYQLYVRDVATGETTQLTTDLDRKVYHPRWSPDGKKILFGDKDFSLFVVDLATKKRTKIDESHYLDNDEFTWEVSDYAWSPDSRWVAYSLRRENRNNAIFLYDTLEGRKVQLTDDFYENLNPRFDADGGYLYFLSYRNYQIGMDPFEDNHIVANPARVMVAQLRKGEKPPFVKRPATEPAPRRRGREGRGEEGRPGPLPRGRRGPRVARLPAAGGPGQPLPPAGRQGLRRLVLGAALHRGRVRGVLPPGRRHQVDVPRLLDEGREGGRSRGQDRGGAGLGERRGARPPEGEGPLRHLLREGVRVEEARDARSTSPG